MAKNNYVLHEGLWWVEVKRKDNVCVWASFNGKVVENLDVVNLPQANADKWEDLDWTNTALNNPDLPTGWLDPAGIFTGCEYYLHSYQAEYIHKMSERDLEAKGYIKITYANGFKNVKPYFSGVDFDLAPTPEQIKYLKNNTECNVDEFMAEVRWQKIGGSRR